MIYETKIDGLKYMDVTRAGIFEPEKIVINKVSLNRKELDKELKKIIDPKKDYVLLTTIYDKYLLWGIVEKESERL